MKITLKFSIYLGMAVVLLFTSCSKDNEPAIADTMDIVSGINQSALVGTVLPRAIEVIVRDQNGDVFTGAVVNFSVTEGSVSAAKVTTNKSGTAITEWTLGASVGKQDLTITAFKGNGTTPLKGSPITVSATATPLPLFAESITLVSGGGQTAIVETALKNPIEVVVKDQNGDAFEGTVVNFSVAEGSVSSATSTTDANGLATVSWTLGTSEGTQILTVTAFKEDGITPLTGSPISAIATATPKPIAIGDFYEGGVVFYIDETGLHGLVCAISDQSTGAEWGCFGTLVGADGVALGTGMQNTIDIEAGCTTSGTAADLVANLTLNSYSDWFLPSQGEISYMGLNKALINVTALENGGDSFAESNYWCSSEENTDRGIVLSFHTTSNTGYLAEEKNTNHAVRAVRVF